MDFLVAVALTDDAAAALLQITGTPRAVEIVERHKPVLNVHTGTHLEGAAHKHTHLTGTHLCEQFLLPNFGIGFMDERDLLTGDAAGYELFPDVVINCERRFFGCILTNGSFQRVKFRTVEVPACGLCRSGCRHCRFRRGEVTEDELGELICLSVLPDGIDIVHAQVDLTACLIGQVGIDNALVKPQLAPIRGDLEHIIGACVHDPRVDSCSTLGKLLHHAFLNLCRLCHDVVIDWRRCRQVQLIRRLDVGGFLE